MLTRLAKCGQCRSIIYLGNSVAERHPPKNIPKNDNEERLELLLKATDVGIWDWKIKTGELTFNQRWAEIIGYTVEELQPMSFETWADKVHPDDLKNAETLLEKHWAGEIDLYEVETRMLHKKGHYVWVLATGKVVESDPDGSPKHMIGIHLDITERKERERERLVETQLLEESQKNCQGRWVGIKSRNRPTFLDSRNLPYS